MGRVSATAAHLTMCLAGGLLYFLFVLPRWWELMGDTSHVLGTVLRIVAGALLALAALPVVLSLQRARTAESGTPGLALRLRMWSAVAQVLAGLLIVATAITEIWVSLDTAGPLLFGIYGAAAALAILGILAFYLSFVAEQPPAPPAPPKPKKVKKRKRRRGGSDEGSTEEPTTPDTQTESEPEEPREPVGDVDTETEATPAEVAVKADTESGADSVAEDSAEAGEPEPAAPGALQNRRPMGKTRHRLRRRSRGTTALED